MATHDVAIIGTGDPDADGYAMAYYHADAYGKIEGCDLVACADIVPENAAAFAREYGVSNEHVYEDYEEMLAEVEPDVVSVTVPPAVHADVVVDVVRSGVVEAVHCEKPMAYEWGDACLMAQEADRRGVNLTFNHQRRFGKPFRRAKELLDAGEIGELERVEFSTFLFYDYGTHSIDLCNYFNDETSPEWVIGQVNYTEERRAFGAHNANHAFALWEYQNGVHGVGAVGDGVSDAVACHNRLIGSEGVIEVGPEGGGEGDDLPALRIRRDGSDWEAVDTEGEGLHSWDFLDRAVADAVKAFEEGRESELCARNALNATEIIFGTYESARRRGCVEFPLEIDDNPLVEMVRSGALDPKPADRAE
jgi:predicted dehydrogenase